ncbi:MAG TPA: ribosome assembly cofactor RimP [Bacteroidales bacterium]|nr:ribosome assembly cofactor RimP [Bacteroidales bacterium]
MIEKEVIKGVVEEHLKGSDIFLVAVKVSSANKITVLADRKGGITIDECVSIHRFIESKLDREVEDYELQVSSPGLDLPFIVTEQYYKNEGKKIEVIDREGGRFTGVLKNVTSGGFELETEVKSKGKARELKDVSFNFDNVKSARVVLILK